MEGIAQVTKKKKVLFLLEGFDKGGIEQVTLDIVNHLDPETYDITVQTFWYGGHCQSLVHPNITVKPFFLKRYVRGIIRLINYLSPKVLYALFVHGNYDVEIAASDGGAAKVISGSTNKKAKKLCWVHMDVSNQGSKLKEYRSKQSASAVYSKFEKIICVSDYAKTQFQNKFGFEDRVISVHNPLPVASIQQKANELVPENIDHNAFQVVAVGSLMKVKGFERLIRVCGEIGKEKPLHLNIVGSGPMENELQELIEKERYHNVSLLGFQANPYPYIKNADLLVCSSYSEAYPLVIGESFALGTPVLGTRCSGVCEWMEQDQSGLIVENSEEALYDGIKLLSENQAIYQDYQKRAAEKQKTLNFENAMEAWESAFLS